jgi:hypothetical protein
MMHITHWGVRVTVTMAAMISAALFVILVVDPKATPDDAVLSSMAVKAMLFFIALIAGIAAFGMQQEHDLHHDLYKYLAKVLWSDKSQNITFGENRHAILTYEFMRFRVELTFLDSLLTVIFIVDASSIEVYQSVALEVPVHVTADGTYVGKFGSGKFDTVLVDYKHEMKSLTRALKMISPP